MTKFVISKLDADTAYQTRDGDAVRRVLVRGGVGIAVRRDGVRTEVSDDDAEFLAQHAHFKQHQAGGFVKIVDAEPVITAT